MFPGKLWKILVGQVKRERERSEVGSFRISNRLLVFDVILAPWVTRHFNSPKKRIFIFQKKIESKNRILKKSKIRVRVKGEINCRDSKIFNSYVPWGGKTLTQATPSAPDREELEKETIPDIKKATKWQRWDFIFLIKVIKNVITANFMKIDIFAENLSKFQNFRFLKKWQDLLIRVMTFSGGRCIEMS